MDFKYQFYRFMCNVTFGKLKQFYTNKKFSCKSEFIQEDNSDVRDTYSYDLNRKKGEKVRNDYCFDSEIGSLAQYHILNELKLQKLKTRIAKGKKVIVMFFIDSIQRLSAVSVFSEMLKNDVFEPFMVLYSHKDKKFKESDFLWDEYKKDFATIKNTFGDKVFSGYDEDKNFIPVENFTPDIIFTSTPYLDYDDTLLTNIYLNMNYLVCYLPYASVTFNVYDYVYNNRRLASCWKYFPVTRFDYQELIGYSKYCGTNAVFCGNPKLDRYACDIAECKIPDKINNGKPIIIYAPHYSINWKWLNLANFHKYYTFFRQLVTKYPEFNFVFKPHPNLKYRVIEEGIMTEKEWLEYIDFWENSENAIYINDGEYIDLFRKSSLLIQDSASFILEWLPTEKPCIYLMNTENNDLLDSLTICGKKALDTYYLAYNEDDIMQYFHTLMFDKSDEKKDFRKIVKNEIFANIGSAGLKIVEYLEKILLD